MPTSCLRSCRPWWRPAGCLPSSSRSWSAFAFLWLLAFFGLLGLAASRPRRPGLLGLRCLAAVGVGGRADQGAVVRHPLGRVRDVGDVGTVVGRSRARCRVEQHGRQRSRIRWPRRGLGLRGLDLRRPGPWRRPCPSSSAAVVVLGHRRLALVVAGLEGRGDRRSGRRWGSSRPRWRPRRRRRRPRAAQRRPRWQAIRRWPASGDGESGEHEDPPGTATGARPAGRPCTPAHRHRSRLRYRLRPPGHPFGGTPCPICRRGPAQALSPRRRGPRRAAPGCAPRDRCRPWTCSRAASRRCTPARRCPGAPSGGPRRRTP